MAFDLLMESMRFQAGKSEYQKALTIIRIGPFMSTIFSNFQVMGILSRKHEQSTCLVNKLDSTLLI